MLENMESIDLYIYYRVEANLLLDQVCMYTVDALSKRGAR